MIRTSLILLLMCSCLAVPGPVRAQEPDQQALKTLLDEFLAGASRGDAATHERFWADDLIYTSSRGSRFGKADILSGLSEAPQDPEGPQARYWAEDTQFRLLGDTAIVAFRLMAESRATSDAAPEISAYFNTGTFLRKDGEWRAVAWQATQISEPD